MGIIIIDPPAKPKAAEGLTDQQYIDLWRYFCVHAQATMPLLPRVKAWWTSRMMWFGGILTAIGTGLEIVVLTMSEERELVQQVAGSWGPLVLIVVGIGIKVLRYVTKSAIK